ncbi:MAG: tol-pal system YbgF family protein, partial [Candidatus Binatia bacterium]
MSVPLAGESRFRLKEFEQAAEHLGAVTQEGVDDSLRGPALLRLGESLAALQQWAKSEEAFRT